MSDQENIEPTQVVEDASDTEAPAFEATQAPKSVEASGKKPRTEKQMEVFKRAQEARAQKALLRKAAASLPPPPQPQVDPLKLYAELIDRQNRHIETLIERSTAGRRRRRDYDSSDDEPEPRKKMSEEKKNTRTVEEKKSPVAQKRKSEEPPAEERDIDTFELKPSREQPKRTTTARVSNMNQMLKLLGY